MPEKVTDEDLELLGELGVETAAAPSGGRTPREQRIIAGFEEIERFVEEHGHPPRHGEDRDIFERVYAVRLDRIRASEECRGVLKDLDLRGLLAMPAPGSTADGEASTDQELLAALGVEPSADNDEDITQLVHVRSTVERKAAEDVAQRTPCADFELYRPLFERVQQELANQSRRTSPFKYREDQAVEVGDWFILDGQKAYVASGGETYKADYGEYNRRLKVIFDNGTESDLLMRSMQRALNKDENSRRILPPDLEGAPLFSSQLEEGDLPTGTIYVLRSKSDDPFVAAHRSTIHKIGVTGGDVKARIANAAKDPTYLLADVEIVQTYQLANINRRGLENILHRVFHSARLDVQFKDRFGSQVEPREWFLVPLGAIDEVINRIVDGTIDQYQYDPKQARLMKI